MHRWNGAFFEGEAEFPLSLSIQAEGVVLKFHKIIEAQIKSTEFHPPKKNGSNCFVDSFQTESETLFRFVE